MIGPVSFQYPTAYIYPADSMSKAEPVGAAGRVSSIDKANGKSAVTRAKQEECQTCKNRRYVDASNDPTVSFKTPTRISPQSSYAVVSSHEQEHVANAYNKASLKGGRVVYASVSLKVAVCPECHTPYVAGGETRTRIEYDTSNPYENNRKALEGGILAGMNLDLKA